jgi:hypothetical protein
MPNPIQSTLSPFEISLDGGVTFKLVVCTKSYTVPFQTQTTTDYTQCGPIVGTGPYSHNPTIQAVCELYPSTTQFTYKDAISAQNALTKVIYRVQYPGTGSIGYGYYICGFAYITDTTLTNQTNSAVNFSFTLNGLGTPSLTPGVLPT